MQDILGSIWWLIVALGILVTFHEYGHYLVARLCGVRVLRFSVGFGKPLWMRRGRDGTEYVIAALPLGGYVKMLDEREADVPASQLKQAFNRKPVSQRIAIVAAGPAFNLLLCLLLLWGMFLVGKSDFQPLVGRVQNLAAEAGVQTGDRIVSVAGTSVDNWTHVLMTLGLVADDRRPIEMVVRGENAAERSLTLDLAALPADYRQEELLRLIGLSPLQLELPPVVGSLQADGAAERAGLKPGDTLRFIDGEPVQYFYEIAGFARAAGEAGRAMQVQVERDGRPLSVELRPELKRATPESEPSFLIGIGAKIETAQADAVLKFGPVAAIGAAGRETLRMVRMMFGAIYRMASGNLQNLAGPITIAQVANDSARAGTQNFVAFLAMLSLSLCIMNLLPIPILDGGHLLYYLIEAIKGAPLSEKSLIAGQYVGLVMLGSLMALAFYNDIVHRVLG